jgi:hypothetical protein
VAGRLGRAQNNVLFASRRNDGGSLIAYFTKGKDRTPFLI